MEFIDTHCHIHFPDYPLDPDEVMASAAEVGVTKAICVGCSMPDSIGAVEYVKNRDNVWASIGLHPHEASRYIHDHKALQQFHDLATAAKVVAIGECGLDYYYNNSSKNAQKQLLKFQLDIAKEHDLPLIFHVRDAFEDFWPIIDEYKGLEGVIHSFTATESEVNEIVKRGLMIGLNGIMTFSKNLAQIEAAKAIPLDNLVLETDAPYLTPVPFRGKICEPKYVRVTAEFLSDLRGDSLESIAAASTNNAQRLFKI